jgi:hypothetical protein
MAKQIDPSPSTARGKSGSKSESRLTLLRKGKVTEGTSWGSVSPQDLAAAIEAVTASGALISFSMTGDGGAMALLVIDNKEKERWYAHEAPEMSIHLGDLTAMYLDL